MKRFFACLLCATTVTGPASAADRALLAQATADSTPAEKHAGAMEEEARSGHGRKRGVIMLEDAIRKAIAVSPRLRASLASQAASRGERTQAGKWVNPEASIGADNVGGKGSYRGIDSAEITYGVSQLIEVGGKRSARVELAEQGVTLAGFDYQAARLDLIRDVELAYADAIAAQQLVETTREQRELSHEVLGVVGSRVEAAREPSIQRSKAEVALSSSTIAYDKAVRQSAAAKRTLATLLGVDPADLALDTASFLKITKPRPLADASATLEANPDFARYDAELARRRAALDLEKANAIPDPRLNAGVRDIRVSNDKAFVVGVSLPIPVLNRNQGSIERARQDVTRTESEREAAAQGLGAELARAQADLESSYHQAVVLRDKTLPTAKKAFAQAREGYGAGKFSYLEVLDAQRTLYETRAEYQDTLRNYHRNRAEVERLTAAHLDIPNTEGEHHGK